MRANLGDIELFEPLKWILTNPPKKNYSRQIFVLADGEISNAQMDILIERIDFNNVQSIVSSLTATRHAAKSFVNDTHSILEGKSL
ncbi:unnamed protein product [Didymodactylos carnosus]|uniref:Uncharacterized protein n=1 Tax=Didymodactylos carnosus TaxID=1234261 RepID=A0A8S2Q5L6_9BILA|nr:unnamed protein product [Didymodactylos carnosus]CAF4082228.1 unnamed protein product [Didymodactylos carnosus]